MSSPRVLCYAPYNRWALHGMWEMTILRSLQLRGAEVQYVLCDGLYTDCDQFWGAMEPRPANACISCQASVMNLVAQMGMDSVWLGRYLTTEEGREARRWADSLAPEELLGATYGNWEVGEWIRSSVQSHFRANKIDVQRPAMEKIVRSYVYSGLIACFGLDRLLVESAPDVMLLFNGRQSSTRVALELARQHDVRTVVHERGLRYETLSLVENERCYSLEPYRRYWREWGEVPLTESEVHDAARQMAEREHGRGLAWSPLTAPPQPLDEVRDQLGLSAERPTWVLFTSSDDETAGEEDYASPFGSQREWIERTIEHARRNPQLDLVIRVHPNTGSRRSIGANREQLEEMKQLGESLPPNVRMIDPDVDISSYSLMEICAVGLVWISTVGLELACKGKNVVVAAGNYVAGTSFVHTVRDAGPAYERMLSSLNDLEPGAVSSEIKRLALRLAYGMFFRIPIDFPLVSMPDHKTGRLTYNSTDALLPGHDAGLDRCVRVLLEGERVCPPPSPADLARSTEAEDAFLKAAAGKPRLTVLAYAEELIADDGLLAAWGETFGADAEVTLLIHTPAEVTPHLVQAVTRAGLDREDGPDLVAGELDEETMASVAAVFSHRESPAGAPRYDAASLAELAKVA